MGVFDSFPDIPDQIKVEGEKINLQFLPGVPNRGQATIKWNIPAPALGCTAADGLGVYGGIVIVLSTTPVTASNIPIDGTVYDADPTADPDKHAGDRIGNALVIGATYECEQRARQEDLTTSIVVSDIDSKTAYFVAAYAHDCQFRHHKEGVRAYSDRLGRDNEPGTPARQVVLLGVKSEIGVPGGVLPTDGTGLVSGATYRFELIVDNGFPDGKETIKNFIIEIDGNDTGTYQDLVNQINLEIAKKCNNAIQSPVAPGTGLYVYKQQKVQQWDGTKLIDIENVLYEANNPTTPLIGDYWFNSDTNILSRWQNPNVSIGWNPVSFITYKEDPRILDSEHDYWFNGTMAYTRCGNTWCEQPFYNSSLDPSLPIPPKACAYWLQEIGTNSTLFVWNNGKWNTTSAISWFNAPNELLNGTFWFDLNTNKLFESNNAPTITWTERVVIISDTTPGLLGIVAGNLWFNPTTEILFQRNLTNTQWLEIDVLVWTGDPTNVESCNLWLNPNVGSPPNEVLYKWDSLNNQWDLAEPFFISSIDPFCAPTLEMGTIWFNPSNQQLSVWNGVSWDIVDYLTGSIDPTVPVTNAVWFNNETKEWKVWDSPVSGNWNTIDPIVTKFDPFTIPQGTIWVNTLTNTIYQRIGIQWISIPYNVSAPIPKKHSQWFDTTKNHLNQWDGSKWNRINPCATARLDDEGNLIFETTDTGSKAVIIIPVPRDVPHRDVSTYVIGTGQAALVESDLWWHEYADLRSGTRKRYYVTEIPGQGFLFGHLSPPGVVLRSVGGDDGVSGTPTYNEIGIGTDGSPDERRKLSNDIRIALGHPTIQVELTNEQIDRAIQNSLEVFRQRSSSAYKRAAFFLDVRRKQQHYILADKAVGFNKIVNVMAVYRFTSAFLSSAHGAGIYGQIVMQHLYNMGTFDLLSFYLVADYVENLEILFAARPTFHWDESSRTLALFQAFHRPERLLLDVTLEKPEQEIFLDRWSKQWIYKFALAEAMDMLSQIRGKYSTLPGAGGGVTLNSADLASKAEAIRTQLYQEIEDMLAQEPEDYGHGGVLVIG